MDNKFLKILLRLAAAVVKAQVQRAVGDETLRSVADALNEIGQEALAARLDDFLGAQTRREALQAALARADQCAQTRLQDTPWREMAGERWLPLREMAGERGLPLSDLPSLVQALEALPEDDLDESRLREALAAVFRQDWQATDQQAQTLADQALLCLREALLDVETDALRTLGRSVLRTEAAVKRLEQALEAWQTQALSSIRIEGSVANAVLVIGNHNTVQLFLRNVRVDHQPRVRRFLEEYLGTPDRPVPFGGRKANLEHLTRWLEEDPQRPYFFLHALAGRGKSALLTRWATTLAQHSDWAVVFVPISLRTDTHRPSVFLHLLAYGLSKVYDLSAPLDETDPEVLLSIAAGYLDRAEPLQGKRGLLVVLDGLDEAAWPLNAPSWRTLFPARPPAHVRVVVSARANAAEAPAWLSRLNWRRGLTRIHHLENLSLQGVCEVLAQMQVPLDDLSQDVDLVTTLYRLTDQGDPLLVGLYAKELLDTLEDQGIEAARQRAYRIGQLVGSGYATFVEDFWWPELNLWWRAQGLPGDTEARVRLMLDLLALARGPIPEQDLLSLARRATNNAWDWDVYMLDHVWENLARVVLRRSTRTEDNEQRTEILLTFAHPRLREYFSNRLTTRDRLRRQDLESHYRDWLKDEIRRIAHAEETPPSASPYVLQYALHHLAAEPLEILLPLVKHPGWHRARYALEGTYEGYLEDVRAVWTRAEQENERALADPTCDASDGCRLPAMDLETRCALIEASIHSLAGRLPPQLPALLVENGLWTAPQALAHVRQMPEEWRQAGALSALAPVLARKAPRALAEALAAARNMESDWHRAEALAALAPHLPEGKRQVGLAEALAAARSIGKADDRARALAALAPHLPEGERQEVLAEALAATRSIGEADDRARALAALAPHLPQGLLAEALAAARSIESDRYRAEALAALAPHLPTNLRQQALAEALQAARSIKSNHHRAEALAILAPNLPKAKREDVLEESMEAALSITDTGHLIVTLTLLARQAAKSGYPQAALAIAQSIMDAEYRAKILTRVVHHLPKNLLPEALVIALTITWEKFRAEALVALIPHLPKDWRKPLLEDALSDARHIGDEGHRALALAALIPFLPSESLSLALESAHNIWWKFTRDKALTALAHRLAQFGRHQEALDTIHNIKWEKYRAEALAALAPYLPENLLPKAFALTRGIKDPNDHSYALSALAPCLAKFGHHRKALDVIHNIKWEEHRNEALAALIPYLSTDSLEEILTTIRNIWWMPDRAKMLTRIIPYLPPNLRQETLADAAKTARSIWWEPARTEALAALAPHLSKEERQQTLTEAIQAARGIEDGDARAKALAVLVSNLPKEECYQVMSDVLQAALSIESSRHRAEALAALAPHLPEELLTEALRSARSIQDKGDRARALVALAIHLPQAKRHQILTEALQTVQGLPVRWPWGNYRANTLATLSPHLSQIPPRDLYPLWKDTLPVLAFRTRQELLADLQALAPVIHALGGEEAIAETFRAIQDVGRWWP